MGRMRVHRGMRRAVVCVMTLAGSAGVAGAQRVASPMTGPPVTRPVSAAPAPAAIKPESLSTLAGHVTDSAGRAIGFATVITDSGPAILAQRDGSFRLAGVHPGPQTFTVKRIGYQPLMFEMEMPAGTTVTVQLKLLPVTEVLKPVVVEGKRMSPGLAKAGFYERQRSSYNGIFIDPEELGRRTLVATDDIFRGLPSVTVSKDGSFTHIYGRDLRCPMDIYLDGHSVGQDFNLRRDLPPDWVKAIEIYTSANNIPPQFQRQLGCGAIVIWTRID
jgi:hypothetical protein